MKSFIKRLCILWIAAFIIVASIVCPVAPRAKAAGSVAYITVELLPISEGFLCPPATIEIKDGETAAETLLRFLAENGYSAYYSGSPSKNFELKYIADGNSGGSYNGYTSSLSLYPVNNASKIKINGAYPQLTQNILNSYGISFDPKNDKLALNGHIGEADITDLSCWIFSINNRYVPADLALRTLSDGDVLRVQFSLVGGNDIGFNFTANGNVIYNSADRSELIKISADNADKYKGLASYGKIYQLLQNISLSAKDIKDAAKAFDAEVKALETTTDKPDTSTTKKPDTSTTKKPDTSTTKKPDTSTTKKPDTSTTKKPDTSTTKKPDTSTTKKPDTSTTKKPDTSTTKKNDTSTTKKTDTSTTKKPAVSTTKKPDASTTKKPGTTTTKKPATPTTKPASFSTTVPVTGETLPIDFPEDKETTERPDGIVLPNSNKATATDGDAVKNETTCEISQDNKDNDGSSGIIEKIKNIDGKTKKIIIACTVVSVVAVAVLIFKRKAKDII